MFGFKRVALSFALAITILLGNFAGFAPAAQARLRGNYCINPDYEADGNICVYINIHDFYGWKQGILRSERTSYLFTRGLHLRRNGVTVQQTPAPGTGWIEKWGDGAIQFSTAWDKSCSCATWYVEAFNVEYRRQGENWVHGSYGIVSYAYRD